MGTGTKAVEVDDEILNDIHDIYECEVEFEWHWENNSIGSVEFWGSMSHDDQDDYKEIENITYSSGSKTHEQKLLLEAYIIANEERIKDEIYKLNE